MQYVLILIGSLFLSLRVSAQTSCSQFIPIHSIISEPDGVLNIDDENGARQIKATIVNTPTCPIEPLRPSGRAIGSNSTSLSQAGGAVDNCEIKIIDGVKTIESFQAVVVRTNGWLMNNASLTFQDIDASPRGWKEASAIFGVRDGTLVTPSLELNDITYLSSSTFKIPAAAVSLMELSLGDINVPGVEYTSPTINNCPNNDVIERKRCEATYTFSSPVDTIVALYILVDRGPPPSRSASSISELRLSCGCRCRETSPGTRTITSAIPGLPGQCERKETSGTKIECDVLGGQWCVKKDTLEYVLTGSTLPSGNLECEERARQKVTVQSAFSPDPVFGAIS